MRMKRKKLIKEVMIAIVIVFLASNILNWMHQPKPETNLLPPQTVTLLGGEHYVLHKGQPVVLHFWATWCRVCKLEAANIEHLSHSYEVLTIAVNSGNEDTVRRYMKEHGLHFKVLNDPSGKWAKKFGVTAFPTTFFFDAKGKLRFTEVGYTTIAGLTARIKLIE